MKTKTLVATLAIASFAFAQPVGAATRSYESLPDKGVDTTAAAERIGSISAEAEALRGSPIIIIVLLGGLIAVALLAGSSGNSPG